jgi:hypothetical protein
MDSDTAVCGTDLLEIINKVCDSVHSMASRQPVGGVHYECDAVGVSVQGAQFTPPRSLRSSSLPHGKPPTRRGRAQTPR